MLVSWIYSIVTGLLVGIVVGAHLIKDGLPALVARVEKTSDSLDEEREKLLETSEAVRDLVKLKSKEVGWYEASLRAISEAGRTSENSRAKYCAEIADLALGKIGFDLCSGGGEDVDERT